MSTVTLPEMDLLYIDTGKRLLLDRDGLAAWLTKCAETFDAVGGPAEARLIRTLREALTGLHP